MKTFWIAFGVFIVVVLFAFTMTFYTSNDNVVKTVIKIDNEQQYKTIVTGQHPYIIFDSLRDTPFNDQIKILKVKIHYTNWVNMFTLSLDKNTRQGIVGTWLGEMGIRSYPELVNDD